MRRILERLFGKTSPPPAEPARKPRRSPKRADRWTREEDAAVMGAAPMSHAARWNGKGESEIQMLARKLGRSEQAIRDRRVRLADPGYRAQRALEQAERDERDRELIGMIERGASLDEAARRAGVSVQRICRMLKQKAPALDRSISRQRGLERRSKLQRIAREIAPRVHDAALAGEGLTLTCDEVAQLCWEG